MMPVPYFRQKAAYTCGPACLEMVFSYYGKKLPEKTITQLTHSTKDYGTDHEHMISAARKERFFCYVHRRSTIHTVKDLTHRGFPVIVNYVEPMTNQGHYAVVVGFSKAHVILNDPLIRKGLRIPIRTFERRWYAADRHELARWILVLDRKPFELGRQYAPTRARSSKATNSSRRLPSSAPSRRQQK